MKEVKTLIKRIVDKHIGEEEGDNVDGPSCSEQIAEDVVKLVQAKVKISIDAIQAKEDAFSQERSFCNGRNLVLDALLYERLEDEFRKMRRKIRHEFGLLY